ncbi:MAG: O-antigen ligase family protein [Gammaproteobacteria bacterium]|nr:O-antigen ligase family protein [Gammaproteobacteria bacterium]
MIYERFRKRHRYLPVYVCTFLLLLSSSVKPTLSFFEGADRNFSPVVGYLAKSSWLFALVGVALAGGLYFFNSVMKLKQPVLGTEVNIFLLLKGLACISYLAFGLFDFDLALSFAIILLYSSYLISVRVKHVNLFDHLTYSIAVFACVFSLLNVYEYIVNPSSVVWSGRLYGVTNHPNFIGGYAAMMVPFVLWSIKVSTKSVRVLLSAAAFVLISIVLLSGSRSSLVSLLIGCFTFFLIGHGPNKTFIYSLFFIIVGIPLTYLIYVFSAGSDLSLDRLLLMENTREYVNFELWSVFMNNPIFGNPGIAGSTSNSYLLILARFGLLGALILMMLIGSILFSLLKLVRASNLEVGSAYIGALAVILPYSIFEGVLVENYSLGQAVFLICLIYIGNTAKVKRAIN